MTEGNAEHTVISALHPVGDGIAAGTHLVGLNDFHLKEGNDSHGKEEGYHQVDGDGDGKVFQCVMEGSFHCQQQGVEDDADA